MTIVPTIAFFFIFILGAGMLYAIFHILWFLLLVFLYAISPFVWVIKKIIGYA